VVCGTEKLEGGVACVITYHPISPSRPSTCTSWFSFSKNLCAFPVLGVGDVADTKRVDGDNSRAKDPSGR
jgi:hypothetical protein